MSAAGARSVVLPSVFAGGGTASWSTDEARRRLGEIHRLAMGAVWAWSARVLDVAQLELKQAFALHVYRLAEVAVAVEQRLIELRVRDPRRLPAEGTTHDALEALVAAPAPEFLDGLYGVWLAELDRLLAAYADDHDSLTDWPSGDLVGRARRVVRDIRTWGDAARSAFRAAGHPPSPRTGLAAWAAAWDGTPYQRPCTGQRDERYRTFGHTRDYRETADFPADLDGFEADRFELTWVNRDEIDAVETFLLGLHDLLTSVPTEVVLGLSRIALDEARHTELGHRLLSRLGHDPFGAACSTIGIDVRARMHGWTSLAQISLFGELAIIGPMMRLSRTAADHGDDVTAGAFAFISSDERLHLQAVRRYLARFTPERDIGAVERATRESASRILHRLGLMDQSEYRTLSKREIFQLIGE